MASAREPVETGRKNLLTVCLLIVILLMFAFAVFGSRGVMRILQAEKQKQALQEQLVGLRQQQQELRNEIERLQKDKNYWEQLARTKLGMVREGELIYYLPDKKTEEKGQEKK